MSAAPQQQRAFNEGAWNHAVHTPVGAQFEAEERVRFIDRRFAKYFGKCATVAKTRCEGGLVTMRFPVFNDALLEFPWQCLRKLREGEEYSDTKDDNGPSKCDNCCVELAENARLRRWPSCSCPVYVCSDECREMINHRLRECACPVLHQCRAHIEAWGAAHPGLSLNPDPVYDCRCGNSTMAE